MASTMQKWVKFPFQTVLLPLSSLQRVAIQLGILSSFLLICFQCLAAFEVEYQSTGPLVDALSGTWCLIDERKYFLVCPQFQTIYTFNMFYFLPSQSSRNRWYEWLDEDNWKVGQTCSKLLGATAKLRLRDVSHICPSAKQRNALEWIQVMILIGVRT